MGRGGQSYAISRSRSRLRAEWDGSRLPKHASEGPCGVWCVSMWDGDCRGGPLPRPLSRKRERGEFDRASADSACVQVKPRAGRDSGPSRGFPLFQPRVHPPLGRGLAAAHTAGSPAPGNSGHADPLDALRRACGGSLGRCRLRCGHGSPWPLRRDDRRASADAACVQVKPPRRWEAFRCCSGGFTRSRRRDEIVRSVAARVRRAAQAIGGRRRVRR